MEQNKIRTYIFYAIGEIILVVIGDNCPVSDEISVVCNVPTNQAVPVGTECVAGQTNILTYGVPTARGYCGISIYLYLVPNGTGFTCKIP